MFLVDTRYPRLWLEPGVVSHNGLSEDTLRKVNQIFNSARALQQTVTHQDVMAVLAKQMYDVLIKEFEEQLFFGLRRPLGMDLVT